MIQKATKFCWDILPQLLNCERIAGYCDKTRIFLEERLKKIGVKTHTTNKGGIIVKLKGKNNEKVRLLTAHMDTLGAMVTTIGSNGRIYLTAIGGVSPLSIEGEYVNIETVDGKRYRGTVLLDNPSAHVNKEAYEGNRTFKNISVRLDEKVNNAEGVKKLGIETGDFCFFDPRVEVTESGFVKSRHLDDKAGVAALLGAIFYLSEEKVVLPYETWFYISAAEEVGHGATSMLPANCFEFVAIDMGALGDGLAGDEYSVSICVKDSSGPFDYDLRKKIVNVAQRDKIPYKLDVYPYYGSDAAAAIRTGLDAKHALFGPGIDASHSYERVHKDALDATVSLIINYVQEK